MIPSRLELDVFGVFAVSASLSRLGLDVSGAFSVSAVLFRLDLCFSGPLGEVVAPRCSESSV